MALIPVHDTGDFRLRPFSGMADGQLRRGEGFRRDCPHGLFIGESAKVIMRAIQAGIQPLSVLGDTRWLSHDAEVVASIQERWPDTPIFQATPEQFQAITGYQVVRGVLACLQRPAPRSVEDILAGARRVAVLEGLTNYANMGALFRSAAALNVDGVLVAPSCHDPYYRRCARVSMGAVFQVPWARVPQDRWPGATLEHLGKAGFTTAALALREPALSLRDSRLKEAERLALVLGSEGDGLSEEVIKRCRYTVCIPMAHGVDSLNVAACAAIAFWETSPEMR